MTRKSTAKQQRARTATKAKHRAPAKRGRVVGGDTVAPVGFRSAKEAMEYLQTGLSQDVAGMASPVLFTPVVKKERPSARCAIVATAFRAATSRAIRRELKGKSALALVVLVPGPSWIQPVRKLFVAHFGDRWQEIVMEALKTQQQKSDSNVEVAADLAGGRPVIGIAVERDALPTALTTAADLTIRINAPTGATIGRAIRMFTGQRVPRGIDDGIVAGLEFHDLVAAFRANSLPAEIIERLKKAVASVSRAETTERLPKLEDAVEYGDARTWGLALARDLADYRGGRLDWQNVDRGAVLFSEPGLGKTLYARILARACGVPLVAFSVADLFANSPGYLDSVVKASRAMFERAAAVAPCILFLDEIDALPNRATMSPRGADWWTPVITDFLLSLDNAVAGKRAGIVVVAATNNIQGVDAAVLRPGRLERAIEIRRPDQAGALNILRHHLDGELSRVDLTDVANLLDGSTGAEIMMAVRGARRVARYANRALELDDLVQATAPVHEIAPAALKRISIHEAAHAVASLVVPSGILKRCSISGSGGVGGRTLIMWETDDLLTRDAIERRAVFLLAGRAAERALIGDVTLGCGLEDDSDMAQVTQVIATLHASSGLGDTLVYTSSYQGALNAVRGDREIRSKVERHLQILQARSEEVVHRHRDAIIAVANRLQTRRGLSGSEIRRIVDATPTSRAGATAPRSNRPWWLRLRRGSWSIR